MIKIQYKLTSEVNWRTLEIDDNYFSRSDSYCDEWIAEELMEIFYAKHSELIDAENFYDKIEFLKGDFWNDIVLPIYKKSQ